MCLLQGDMPEDSQNFLPVSNPVRRRLGGLLAFIGGIRINLFAHHWNLVAGGCALLLSWFVIMTARESIFCLRTHFHAASSMFWKLF
jgi:hypothetical protein